MKIKKKVLKILYALLIVVFIINIFGNTVFAENNVTVVNEFSETGFDVLSAAGSVAGFALDGVAGVLTLIVRIPLLLIVMAFQGLMTGVAMLGGSNIEGILTPDDLFFNRVGLTNINFFDFAGSSDVVQTIRINVATWYYILRILAIVILLAVLIYIGIRMAISTIASEQAKYKRMLVDWVVSFALIFLLNYIIIFTLEINNALISLLEQPVATIGSGITTELAAKSAIGPTATTSWGALIVYAMLVGMTTAFLFTYIKRMLTIGFLIIISPLITITYSIDRVKDGRAQALNTWLKEFMFTVLIQPFHCIIYIVFISAAINLLSWWGSLPGMVLAIVCMSFIWKAEKIVKQIFGFNEARTSLGDTMASMQAVSTIGGAIAKTGGAAGKVASKTKFGQNVSAKLSATPVGKLTERAKENELLNKVGGVFKSAAKVALPIGAGAVAAGFEVGLNSSANAAQVGAQTYATTKQLLVGDKSAPGSKENIKASEVDLSKYANLLSTNNTLGYQNISTDPTSKNALKGYAQSLITANMDMLNSDIQDALKDLRRTPGLATDYDVHTDSGIENLKKLQDMALDENLDFTDPSTNPLGHAWTAEEKAVVTAIQVRNFAQAVQNAHKQYEAAGSSDPNLDIDSVIDGL